MPFWTGFKRAVGGVPVAGDALRRTYWALLARRSRPRRFQDSGQYWEERYARGGSSGDGSYGRLAEYKAEFLNEFVLAHGVQSIVEFGCGDGNQLSLAAYPRYLGVDVSPSAVKHCRDRFSSDPTKSFVCLEDYAPAQTELALSLDVIYHLVEDPVFEQYMRTLFASATRFVIVYSSNESSTATGAVHVRHREFTRWVQEHASNWRLVQHQPNRYGVGSDDGPGSFADFFVFETG